MSLSPTARSKSAIAAAGGSPVSQHQHHHTTGHSHSKTTERIKWTLVAAVLLSLTHNAWQLQTTVRSVLFNDVTMTAAATAATMAHDSVTTGTAAAAAAANAARSTVTTTSSSLVDKSDHSSVAANRRVVAAATAAAAAAEAVATAPLNTKTTVTEPTDQMVAPNKNTAQGATVSSMTSSSKSSCATATVIAMATNYKLQVFQRFVGSLRQTGYTGHVIMGVEPNISLATVDYLQRRNVTVKRLSWMNCTYSRGDENATTDSNNIFKHGQCAHPYPDIKIRWSRFALARDWLQECTTCTGPVLITDARDVVFQRNPFGSDDNDDNTAPKVDGLQVFQEDPAMTTQNWLTEWPIRECKNVTYDQPMLCSGTTVGTREAMLRYLEIMYQEMKVWIEDPKCRFNINGDDQSIHNYLFYSGRLPFATSIANRKGGIVNTVGAFASTLYKKVLEPIIDAHNTTGPIRYPGANDQTWIGTEFGLTNEYGLLVEYDGTVSRVVHQLDRFEAEYTNWLDKQPWCTDSGSISSDMLQPLILRKKDATRTAALTVSKPSMPKDVPTISSTSSTATVMAMATGYKVATFKRFVGSLRRSGYAGHLIIGLQPDPPTDVVDYLKSRNVTIKILKWTNCTYTQDANNKDDIFKRTTCAHPYPDIKIRWSRFPLARDWLSECQTCTGPVLITDARDLVFQRDPFGDGSPKVEGLQVFQEDPAMTTKNWLTEWPIRECKNVTYDKPMLCSGTTVGTRQAMLQYLEIMYREMKVWIEDPKCRFNINGDDQSMHNYLFYAGKLPFATSIANRKGGIVNTVGAYGSTLYNKIIKPLIDSKNRTGPVQYPGASATTWIGSEFGVTNEYGLITEEDGSVSRVIHQLDRFGYTYEAWLDTQPWVTDSGSIPSSMLEPVKRPASATVQTSRRVQTTSPSSTATVMAMATGYKVATFKRFVGSLRRSGYAGHIIIGLQPDPPTDVVDYLKSRNVTIKTLQWTNCTYTQDANDKDDIFKRTTCAHPYPDIKICWSRFPLASDWLSECQTCTGPVLITDARDLVFQRDPFGDGSPKVEGLQVFQEDPTMTTKNWLTEWPIRECKNVTYDKPMLCSGTTVGTRQAMLQYLEIMYREMKVWIEDTKCRFNINGDDQSMHNYLFYSGKLPFATSIANRKGGIVNTVGAYGSTLYNKIIKPLIDSKNRTGPVQYPGASATTWIGSEFGVTNEDGLITEEDGSVSRVIHQLDRFGYTYEAWLDTQPWVLDTGPHPLSANFVRAQ